VRSSNVGQSANYFEDHVTLRPRLLALDRPAAAATAAVGDAADAVDPSASVLFVAEGFR